MALAHSKLVPIAFWIAFVALGLVTSLGSTQKPQVHPKAARHSLVLPDTPGQGEIALRDDLALGPRNGASQIRALQMD